jgi:glycerol-3-phosphate dehydrogenase (NAD(P)+)
MLCYGGLNSITLKRSSPAMDHKKKRYKTFAVLGAGAWGTALAQSLAMAGRDVVLWARDAALADEISRTHRNERRLPGIALDPRLKATSDLASVAARDAVFLAAPAQHMRAMARLVGPHASRDTEYVVCAKGFEQSTGSIMSGVVFDEAKVLPSVISGPGFASEVARGLPTALVLASRELKTSSRLGNAIGHDALRIYFSEDVAGVQIGGAVKNVLAIAAGIVAGRKLGASAQAALVTRAFHELTDFGRLCGAERETLTGLSCLGDLILTCNSPQSRNFTFGRHLGEGRSVPEALEATGGTVEGIYTAATVVKDATTGKRKIEMPIATAVHRIVSGEQSVDQAIGELADRPQKAEG